MKFNFCNLIRKIWWRQYVKRHESSTVDGGKYLYLDRNSKILIVVFSGFASSGSNKRSYNYLTHLTKYPVDLLFILDRWGNRGSYYIMENGTTQPFNVTSSIIAKITNSKPYSKVIFCGTSKGGSAALIFGLKHSADYIIAGACQYYIGNYISNYPDVAFGMLGEKNDEGKISWLNELIKSELKKYQSSKTQITLIYSKKEKERTYQIELIDLIEELNKYNYYWNDEERYFEYHGMIGSYFISYMDIFIPNLLKQI